MGCAAKWKIKSGLVSNIALLRSFKLIISKKYSELKISPLDKYVYKPLLFKISFEIPTTSAPKIFSHNVTQEPLTPVWPVTKTFLLRYWLLHKTIWILKFRKYK